MDVEKTNSIDIDGRKYVPISEEGYVEILKAKDKSGLWVNTTEIDGQYYVEEKFHDTIVQLGKILASKSSVKVNLPKVS